VSQAFFVVGTGTDIGKTFFSSLFLAKYGESHGFKYWKPVQTGNVDTDDTTSVQNATGFPASSFLRPVYSFAHPSSPHLSAKKENVEIDIKKLKLAIAAQSNEAVLIEGAGGIFVPLTESFLSWELVRHSNLKVVLVCSTVLGTINHTLLTLECLLQRFIPVVGFYMVGVQNELIEDNIRIIQKFGGTPCLGLTTFPDESLKPQEFLQFALNHFDTDRLVIESLLDIGDTFDT
jgi:dethiobiotin synthetase